MEIFKGLQPELVWSYCIDYEAGYSGKRTNPGCGFTSTHGYGL